MTPEEFASLRPGDVLRLSAFDGPKPRAYLPGDCVVVQPLSEAGVRLIAAGGHYTTAKIPESWVLVRRARRP